MNKPLLNGDLLRLIGLQLSLPDLHSLALTCKVHHGWLLGESLDYLSKARLTTKTLARRDIITGFRLFEHKDLLSCINQDYELATKLLLEQGIRNDDALHVACRLGYLKIVEMLTGMFGADIEARNGAPLTEASQHGHVEIVAMLLTRDANVHADNDSAIRYAASAGRNEVVQLLLAAGADVHAWGDYALRWATHYGYTSTVSLLLAAGANVHAGEDEALFRACQDGHLEIVKLLLDAEADIHARRNGPLLKACEGGHIEIVRCLLERGARVIDEVVERAAAAGYLKVVELVLEYGPRVDAGYAVTLACIKGHRDVAILIRKWINQKAAARSVNFTEEDLVVNKSDSHRPSE